MTLVQLRDCWGCLSCAHNVSCCQCFSIGPPALEIPLQTLSREDSRAPDRGVQSSSLFDGGPSIHPSMWKERGKTEFSVVFPHSAMPSLIPLLRRRQEQSQNISTVTRAAPHVPISLHRHSRLQTQAVHGATARAPPPASTADFALGRVLRALGTLAE